MYKNERWKWRKIVKSKTYMVTYWINRCSLRRNQNKLYNNQRRISRNKNHTNLIHLIFSTNRRGYTELYKEGCISPKFGSICQNTRKISSYIPFLKNIIHRSVLIEQEYNENQQLKSFSCNGESSTDFSLNFDNLKLSRSPI